MSLLTAARVTVVAGKGGVGKTTVTAVAARAAADAGQRVLVVELDGKPALEQLTGDVSVNTIEAPAALDEYLRTHGFARLSRRLASSGIIDVVATTAPGIDDVVVLAKIKQLERSGDWDSIIVDGPAAGHAITLLTSPRGLADAVRGGPVRAQADAVLELLGDPSRCQVMLVTTPDTTPVNEAVETAYALEDSVGVQLGPLAVNGIDRGVEVPDEARVDAALALVDGPQRQAETSALRAAAELRRARRASQRDELERLSDELALPQLHLPLLATAELSAEDIGVLVGELTVATPAAPGGAR